MLSVSIKYFYGHLSAWLKVRMGERARSLQKLLHMIPPAIPVTTTVPVSTIYSHSGHTTHHILNLQYKYQNLNDHPSNNAIRIQELNILILFHTNRKVYNTTSNINCKFGLPLSTELFFLFFSPLLFLHTVYQF